MGSEPPPARRPRPAIDLRSDTVTMPTASMRQAMACAELGDDGYGEDPTVNRLECLAADLLGHEAALFTASGTMANLLAVLAHCPRGRKVLLGDLSDMWLWEAGGASVLGGIVYQPVRTQSGGELSLADLETACGDSDNAECAPAGLVCLEDTHCLSGGRALSLEYLRSVRAFADARRLPVHVDGARLFNAASALGVDARRIAENADSVAFCLSKGLAAPVGSLLVGGAGFIAHARRLRKLLGGGMRQAGVLAAAGLVALTAMRQRLADDHELARLLAARLSAVPGVELEAAPQTNIVLWRLNCPHVSAKALAEALAHEGVRIAELGTGRLRAVTHYGIDRDDVERAAEAIRRTVARLSAGGPADARGPLGP